MEREESPSALEGPQFLVEQLSPEGMRLYLLMRDIAVSPSEWVRLFRDAGPKDRAILWRIHKYLDAAYQFKVYERARELEPETVDEYTSYEEAVEIILRHEEEE